MALTQADKDKLKALGFEPEKLVEAATAEAEMPITIPEGQFIKEADLEARDANKINEGRRAGEVEGEKKGKELAAKAFKKKFAIESDSKDVDKIAEEVNAKLGKGDDALKEQVNGLLKDKEMLTQQINEERNKAAAAATDATLISLFPAGRTTDLKDNERLVLFKSEHVIETVDGKQVVKRNGEIMKDKTTHAPLPLTQVVTDYFTERKWVSATPGGGGRGGEGGAGGGGTDGIKKASQFRDKWLAENPGKNEMSNEYVNALNQHASANKDFDMYN